MPITKPIGAKKHTNPRVQVRSHLRVTQFNLEVAFAELCKFREACARLEKQKRVLTDIEAEIEIAKAKLNASRTRRDKIIEEIKHETKPELAELGEATKKMSIDDGHRK